MRSLLPNYEGRITGFHMIVILTSFSLTLSAWLFSKHQMEARMLAQFEASRNRTMAAVSERMNRYEDALWAGVAAVQAHRGVISDDDWHSVAATLNIQDRYPGIDGIGVISRVTQADLATYITEQRLKRPDFQVFPPHRFAEKLPITFIEPVAANAASVGLDVAHEANTRTAALLSRDTGQAQITGPITLAQDTEQTSGFLFYAPLYHGQPPRTLEERRTQFAGAVYAPFIVHKLMEGLLSRDLRSIQLSIRDGDTVIYQEHDANGSNTDPFPLFEQEVSIDIYGRQWVFDMRSDLAFRQQYAGIKPTAILIAGLIIKGLIIAFLVMMSRVSKEAVRHAELMTIDLQKKSERLAQTNVALSLKNEELEEYAYIASHDLRTPIRGIGGLTEMIEEDLDAYFVSPQANPDVAANLKRIHERVTRMHELTQGILTFSNATTTMDVSSPIILAQFAETLRCDFTLRDRFLDLRSDVKAITVEPVYFRRVIENLVSNAIKYHDNREEPRIHISIKGQGGNCRVSVADNGPGIDPKFHDRIFAVFQTLTSPHTPDSTGIGLAIVKKLVGRHGGTVSLCSSPGNGATFSFDWPLETTAPVNSPLERAA